MASYEKRKKELLQAIPLLHTDMPSELTLLDRAVEEYFTARDAILTDMYPIAADLGENPRDGDWKGKLAKGRETLEKSFAQALRSVSKPAEETALFHSNTMNQENTFWNTFEKLDLGLHRDNLVQKRKDLEKCHKDLTSKWESITYEIRPLLENSQKSVRELMEHVDKTIERSASLLEKMQYSAARVNEGLKELEKSIVLGAAIDAIKLFLVAFAEKQLDGAKDVYEKGSQTVDALTGFWKIQHDSRIPRFREGVISQAKVLSALPNNRRLTDEFLEKGGVNVVKTEHDEVRASLDRWTNELPTNGLKDDAREIAKELKDKFELHLQAMERAFKDFVEKHQGRFIGELSSSTERELVDKETVKECIRAMSGKELEAKFREWNERIRNSLQRDFEETFRRIEDRLRDQPEEVQKEVRSYVEAFKDQLNRYVTEWIEKIEKSSKEVAELCSPENLQKQLSQEEVVKLLPGK